MHTESGRDVRWPARHAIVWRQLVAALRPITEAGRAPAVLDCGGGSGSFAVPLAREGANVTVLDISADALATLRRRADETGVADRVVAVQADVESLAGAVGDESFDLVLAHGILDAVDDVPAAFAGMARTLRHGGRLSVLVGNPVAGVLARVLAGDLVAALGEMRGLDAGLAAPGPHTVAELCRVNGLLVEAAHGVGVFTDLVPGPALDQPGAADALSELEQVSSARAPFRDIAGRVHVLARRPEDGTPD